jgi:hypothetical protein
MVRLSLFLLYRDGDRSVVLAHVKEHYRVAALSRLNETGCDDMADVSEVRTNFVSLSEKSR